MSKELLKYLNGNNRGPFHEWLEEKSKGTEWTPRIAWYPAAGIDFAPMFYLSQELKAEIDQDDKLPESPEIFLLTDYCQDYKNKIVEGDWQHTDAKFERELARYERERTKPLHKFAKAMMYPQLSRVGKGPLAWEFENERRTPIFTYCPAPEQLPTLTLLDDDWGLGRAWFIPLNMHTDGRYEPFPKWLIYIFADNASFCSRVLLEQQARITHLWYKCAGAPTPWLGYALRRLQTEVVFTGCAMGYYSKNRGPGDDIGFFDPSYKPEDLDTILRGSAEDVPNIHEWNCLQEGLYTKLPTGCGHS